eukprot:gene8045-12367_t
MPAQPVEVVHATPVDADKLWRDRVANELHAAKTWDDQYGYMVHDAKKLTECMTSARDSKNASGSTHGVTDESNDTMGSLGNTNAHNSLGSTGKKPIIDPFARSFDNVVMGKS